MKYDFDSVIDRRNTTSVKWDLADERFNVENILPMWVADMDFRVPQPVIDALKRVAEYGVFGYSTVPQSYYDAVIDWIRKRHNWEVEEELSRPRDITLSSTPSPIMTVRYSTIL